MSLTPTQHQVRYTNTAAIFPAHMPRESWVSEGIMLFTIMGAIQWRIGDWLLYGEENYDTYTQALHMLGLNEAQVKTFSNYVFVANNIPPHRRREELSFGHRDAVASCDAQAADSLLSWAIRENATVRATRAERAKREGRAIPTITTQTIIGTRKELYAALEAGRQYKLLFTLIEEA